MQKLDLILLSLRKRLQETYGNRFVKLILFGSYARGDETLVSDIDILVVLRGAVDVVSEIKKASAITAPLSLENDVVISSVFVQEQRYEKEQSPLLINVRREGRVI